jgi:2-methylcitrate dehydratase PrpD
VVDMVGRPYRPGASPEVDAQFNLAYCLATVLETGNIGLEDLTPARTLDSERRARSDEIAVTLDPALEGKWTSRVRVRNRSGAEISRVRETAASQSDAPLSREDLVAKFLDAAVVSGAFGAAGAGRLADLLLDLPRQSSTAPLMDALTPRPAGAARPCR